MHRSDATMNDRPVLLRPNRASYGHSPSRHVSDDVLAHLAPHSALPALSAATGALRDCLDAASPAERDFAMRSALASQRIWQWVGELSEWHWPSGSASAGFEAPSGRQRFTLVPQTSTEVAKFEFMGSVPAVDVARYEKRIDEIRRDMDALAVEEIKSHVMTNHILPLSRPSTPMSDSLHSDASGPLTFNKMEDLTAVITAIVVQTLPCLAKLSQLLKIWSIRINVLRQISPLLSALEEAKVALDSGWNAVAVKPANIDPQVEASQWSPPSLRRRDFEVMQQVLQKKVSQPGRRLDYMLDCLEGQPETLPEAWLDLMDAVESDYGEWVATCERRIRDTEWADSHRERHPPKPASPGGIRQCHEEDEAFETSGGANDNVAVHLDLSEVVAEVPEPSQPGATTRGRDNTVPETFSRERESELENLGSATFDGADGPASSRQDKQPLAPIFGHQQRLMECETKFKHRCEPGKDGSSPATVAFFVDPADEPELPVLSNLSRRHSNASQTSTVFHGVSSSYDITSSDPPEVSASPGISGKRVYKAEYVERSPPSSPPPSADGEERSTISLEGQAVPTDAEEADSILKTPVDESFQDEFDDSVSLSEMTGPFDRRESAGDQQLRQQLSEIIESIPARIRLSNEPSINLNPPDLQLPRIRKKPSKELYKRSASSLSAVSSRTATPSFTLSPAKNPRQRHSRGQRPIKVYHLSRSTGEAPIKLFIRCVGEHGERVMVRVGGGWADLGEYLKEYASHHGRRSAGTDKATSVEVQGVPRTASGRAPELGSGPSRPTSSLDVSPSTPLAVRKTRRSQGEASLEAPQLQPKTPAAANRRADEAPSSAESTRSRPSSRLSWGEDDSSFLGLAGPSSRQVEMSEENKAWVESVKEKVRLASGERKASGSSETTKRFGQMGKVGGTKRLFRKSEGGL